MKKNICQRGKKYPQILRAITVYFSGHFIQQCTYGHKIGQKWSYLSILIRVYKILTELAVLAVLVPNWCWRCYCRKCPEMLLPGCGGQACGVVVGSDPIMHMVASNFLETQYAHENTNTERPKLFCRIFVLIKMHENFPSKRFWYSAWCIYYSKNSGTLGWFTSPLLIPPPISMLRYIILFCVSSLATKPLSKISWLELLLKAIVKNKYF